jgi:hypothetical protein
VAVWASAQRHASGAAPGAAHRERHLAVAQHAERHAAERVVRMRACVGSETASARECACGRVRSLRVASSSAGAKL